MLEVNKIYCGHVLDILKQIPDEFVDCIPTSPPYYGLRDYGKQTEFIWDGDDSCEHKWGKGIKGAGDHRYRGGETTQVLNNLNKEIWKGEPKGSNFCSKCNAWKGQLGLEPTLDLYIKHLLQVTKELYRVLKKTGVMFWNHGDCYGGRGCGKGDYRNNNKRSASNPMLYTNKPNPQLILTPKCMALQNYRLLIKLIDEQRWIARNQIIWSKPNHMPSSVKDRFASSYEPVFMMVKNNKSLWYYNQIGNVLDTSPDYKNGIEGEDWEWSIRKNKNVKTSLWKSLKYWFDLDAVRLPHKDNKDYDRHAPFNYRVGETKKGHDGIIGVKASEEEMDKYDKKGIKFENTEVAYRMGIRKNKQYKGKEAPQNTIKSFDPKGKNPGDLWTINTQPFPEAHFATFPEKLVEPMIKAACPKEICKKCGKARVRIVEKGDMINPHGMKNIQKNERDIHDEGWNREKGYSPNCYRESKTIDWTDCNCKSDFEPGIVLDPFSGSGTACLVAKRLGINYMGIDLSETYCILARKRISGWKTKDFKEERKHKSLEKF